MRVRRLPLVALILIGLAVSGPILTASRAELPSRLTDQEFWQLSRDLSEGDGAFQSDNLLSNEVVFGRLVPALTARTTPVSAYLGVGPEQNFTYIAATKPRIAFITDIRRGNLHVQLMYKALFELSKDRAEFVSRLFTKPRPATLTASSTVLEIMNAYWDTFTGDEAAFQTNLAAVHGLLTKTHRIPLEQADLDGIANVYRAFYWYGPGMNYSARTALGPATTSQSGNGTYWAMMTQTDGDGQPFSYLASEEKFAVLKDLESRNLIVPVVGNFSGPKALRAVGAYIKEHGATVSAFYLSNVELYLQRDGSWGAFCANVATFPLDDTSVFIRPSAIRRGTAVLTAVNGTVVNLNGMTINGVRTPLQFATFLPNGSLVPVPPGTVTFAGAASNVSNAGVNSASLVPPKSPADPSGVSNADMLQSGLIPIKADVQTCAGR